MRLGATIAGFIGSSDPDIHVAECLKEGYRAAPCPDVTIDQPDKIRDIKRAFGDADIVIAEVPAWVNPLHPDTEKRRVNPAEPAERFLESEQGSHLAGCNLDEGEVDLSPLLAELARSGYEGSIAIEYQGEQDPRETLPHNVRFLRNLMEHVIDNPE